MLPNLGHVVGEHIHRILFELAVLDLLRSLAGVRLALQLVQQALLQLLEVPMTVVDGIFLHLQSLLPGLISLVS